MAPGLPKPIFFLYFFFSGDTEKLARSSSPVGCARALRVRTLGKGVIGVRSHRPLSKPLRPTSPGVMHTMAQIACGVIGDILCSPVHIFASSDVINEDELLNSSSSSSSGSWIFLFFLF